MGGQKMRMPIMMTMEGTYTVKSVDTKGNGTIALKFTRMAMEMRAPILMKFDSSKPADRNNPQFKPMMGILDIPIEATISPRGAVVAMNMDAVNDAMVKAGALTAAEAKQNTEKMMQGSFIQLPEKAMSVGQTYDAGEVVQDAKGMGKMKSKISYTVSQVSADGSQVLLAPKGSLALEPTPGSPMKVNMKSSQMTGWVLFDRSKGNVTKSYVTVQADMDMQQGPQKVSMQMDIKVKYTTK
jgi:polyhydroxyalkanoate synthesis regulator phasin